MDGDKAILEIIKSTRVKKGLSQEAFAEKLGMKQTTYSDLERGRTKLKTETLQRIVEILDIKFENKNQVENESESTYLATKIETASDLLDWLRRTSVTKEDFFNLIEKIQSERESQSQEIKSLKEELSRSNQKIDNLTQIITEFIKQQNPKQEGGSSKDEL